MQNAPALSGEGAAFVLGGTCTSYQNPDKSATADTRNRVDGAPRITGTLRPRWRV